MGARDDVVVMTCRYRRTGKPKDNKDASGDEGGNALHSLALFYGLFRVIWETSHALHAETRRVLALPLRGVIYGGTGG